MAVLFETALELVFRQLLKAVVGQIIQPTRFKILLTRLENTLKSIEPAFYENRSLSKVLDHPEKDTETFISYLENGKEVVLKCSSNKSSTVYKKLLHSLKLIRLNKEIVKFFQVQDEAKKISTSISSLSLPGDFDHEDKTGRVDSAVITPAGGYLTTDGGYPVQQLNLSTIDSFVNLTSIRFEQVSVSTYIEAISSMRNLQKLSFVMCEIGDSLKKVALNMLPNLKDLEFESCYDLKELPSEICNLVHLQNLSITNCHELVALPKRLGSLSNIEILNIHCCTKLQELPESIGSLGNLRFLDISDCLSISQLPERIGELNGLQVLKMSGVHGLQELPESMSKMSRLEEVICDEETSYLWMDFESELYNLRINIVEDDRFGSFLKIVQ